MAVIFALFLVLWAWGRFEILALHIGHGNGSKIDFLFDAYFGVDRYLWTGKNCEMRFQPAKVKSGLHNRYYLQPVKNTISKGFCC